MREGGKRLGGQGRGGEWKGNERRRQSSALGSVMFLAARDSHEAVGNWKNQSETSHAIYKGREREARGEETNAKKGKTRLLRRARGSGLAGLSYALR